jgi:hypothetical protein
MSAKGAEFPVADIENLRRGTADLKQVAAELNKPPPSATAWPKSRIAEVSPTPVGHGAPDDSDGEDTREDDGSDLIYPFTLRRRE